MGVGIGSTPSRREPTMQPEPVDQRVLPPQRNAFPYEPLARLIAAQMGMRFCADGGSGCSGCLSGQHASTSVIATVAGVSAGAVSRWRRTGVIPERSADEVMRHMDLHPMLVWPVEYQALAVAS